jgi:hypothetical protein
VQQLLLTKPEFQSSRVVQLHLRDELSSTKWEVRVPTQTRVLLHAGCHLSDELPGLLKQSVAGIVVQRMDDGGGTAVPRLLTDAVAQPDGNAQGGTRLLVVVHDGCFENDKVVSSLEYALTHNIPVVLVHEADADYRGCTFGSIINQCPPNLQKIVGFGGMKLFGPIAVQWSRGHHQPVSIRLLAKSLGATKEVRRRWQGAGAQLCRSGLDCATRAGARVRSKLQAVRGDGNDKASGGDGPMIVSADGRVRGWSVFGSPGDCRDTQSGGSAAGEPTNPICTNPMTRGSQQLGLIGSTSAVLNRGTATEERGRGWSVFGAGILGPSKGGTEPDALQLHPMFSNPMHATCTQERNAHHGAADTQASQVSSLPQGWTKSTLPCCLNTAGGATTWDRPTAPAAIIAADAAVESREAQPSDITIENAGLGLDTCPVCKRNIDDHTDSELEGCLKRESII